MSRYGDTISDDQYSKPIQGARIYVYRSEDESLAQLTEDGGGALPNPVISDEYGNYHFNADPGIYILEYWYGGKRLLRREAVQVAEGLSIPEGVLLALSAATGASLLGKSGGGSVQDGLDQAEEGLLEAARTAIGLSKQGDVFAYDHFDRPDQLLHGSETPTGQTWSVTGAVGAAPVIEDGMMFEPDQLNFYASVILTEAAPRASMQGIYFLTGDHSSTAIDGAQMVLIVETVDSERSNTLAHLQCGPRGMALESGNAADFEFHLQTKHDLMPEQKVDFAVEFVDATNLIVTDPHGRRFPFNIPENAAREGVKVTLQIFGEEPAETYAMRPKITGFSVGPALAYSPALAAGAPPSDGALVPGESFARLQAMPTFTLTESTRLRVARNSDIAGFSIRGEVTLQGLASDGTFDWAKLEVTGIPNEINDVQTNARRVLGSPFGSVYVTDNGIPEEGIVYLDVDIVVPSGGSVDLRAWSEGSVTLLYVPIPDAVALANDQSFDIVTPPANTGAELIVSYLRRTFVTGETYQIPDNLAHVQNDAGATLAAVTLVLPANPANRQVVRFTSLNQITALTVNAGVGENVVGEPTTLGANGFFAMHYDSGFNFWFRYG